MKGPYEEEHDVNMYGDGMKPQYGITEVKKRRGVSQDDSTREEKKLTRISVLLPQGDAIAATESILRNGDADPTELGLSATHVDYITPSLRENDNSRQDLFVLNLKKPTDNEPRHILGRSTRDNSEST